ncbi:PARS [Mytilus edulis]|uniref:PARS n=1 Tax=Mytilus edulis TaxID=6550 RepID=A0A8S3TCW0_MYTED|nr:PARS [Mytilus edulis]
MLFRSIILQGRQWFLLTDSPRRYRHRKYVSQLFQNLQKIPPQDSQLHCKSHKLMIYNDIIQNCHPGGFHLLPLGQRVLEKLIKVIDEELDTIGAQKIYRWDSAGAELFRLKDRHKQDYCLGPCQFSTLLDVIFSSPVDHDIHTNECQFSTLLDVIFSSPVDHDIHTTVSIQYSSRCHI